VQGPVDLALAARRTDGVEHQRIGGWHPVQTPR
jgi:hypothetical protein